ncbi:MAG: hypothetical protein KDA86_02575 [Planctomycetaceae bacterium]|nr:hypothetical protein [Planctomycetaceae bacterium]
MEAVIVRIRCITEVGVYQPDASADAVPAGGYAELGADDRAAVGVAERGRLGHAAGRFCHAGGCPDGL